jgi:hypothetical protein
MGGDGIYRKTEKGRTEITTRARKLGMRERTMLIMVDDKPPRRDLLSRNPHPGSGDILDSLLAQGFIETNSVGASAAPAAPVAGQPQVEVSLISAPRFACRSPLTYLGTGADDLTVLVEKRKGRAELVARLEKCRLVMQGMAGKKKADDFWAGCRARLPAV